MRMPARVRKVSADQTIYRLADLSNQTSTPSCIVAPFVVSFSHAVPAPWWFLLALSILMFGFKVSHSC